MKAGSTVGEGAFAFCDTLTTVENLNGVTKIDSLAFNYTALTEVDLTAAEFIGDFAFGQSQVEKVTFGDKLKELGENPFYGCQIKTYGKETQEEFNGEVVGNGLIATYDISETIKVIGEVLYQTIPNGLELVSYPIGKEVISYVVEEGTVRIGANAFAGAKLQDVQIASTVRTIGDKAFYECNELTVVVFKSFNAPTLEEAYDASYASMLNLPMTGYYYGYEGLGIAKFYMWNVGLYKSNFYYGANFVNYIGRVDKKLVMVKPSNGQNYGSFILSQYFDRTVNGSNAAKQATLDVIALIAKLPSTVTLADEAAIIAAREAYTQIPEIEQKALVSNYSKLTSAESTLAYLKLREEQPDTPVVEPNKDKGCGSVTSAYAAIFSAVACMAIVGVRRKKKSVGLDSQAETIVDNNEKDKN